MVHVLEALVLEMEVFLGYGSVWYALLMGVLVLVPGRVSLPADLGGPLVPGLVLGPLGKVLDFQPPGPSVSTSE